MKLSDTRWQIMTMGLVGSFFALTVAFFSFQSITSRASPLTTNPLSESTPEALQKQPVYLDKRVSDAFKIQAKSAAVPTIDVLIYLQRPLVKQRVIATKRDERRTQRTEYVNALRSRTDNLQQQVRTALNPQIANKSIVIKRSFFIDNILHASITEEGLKAIQNSPGVIAVVPNEQITLPPQTTTTSLGSWNIAKIAADRVWNDLNITGNGVVVANIDTGVQWDHPALKNAYRGWNGTTADHDYNWYDPSNTSPQIPLDNTGHGTHTMGTIVGFDGTTHIGIAPGAKWIAAKGCINNGCSQSDLLAAGQWMLAPTKLDGTNPDPSKAPDVVNNSWGGFGCNAYYKGVLTAWRNAGIVPIFSSGNSGPNPNTVGSPGDNPEAISVGATDESDAIASFSSKGPSCATFNNNPKPDIAAPGVAINSSIPYDSYTTLNGTSMAAPNATGVVALLLQAKPNLSVYEIEQVLKRSSTDLGATGTDNTFGAGLINAYNAVTMDTSTIPTPTPTPLPPQVKITSPNGGETFQYGQTTPITWTAQGVIEVYLSLVDVTNNTIRGISLSLPNSGSYNWTITDPKGTYNTKYKVRIEAYPNSAWIYDDSDASFTISGIPTPTPQPTPTPTRIPTPTPTPSNTPIPTPTPTKIPTPTPTPQPFLDIVQPSGGETLYESQQYQVKWSTNITGNVGIYLMKEDGMGGTPLLVTVPADQQSYTWTVSKNIFTAASRFKIWIHNGIVGGQSASGFTVLPPQPTPTNTPTPTQIPTSTPTPTPACTPRLPCMDPPKGQEACMVKAPAGTVFCPVTPTPTPASKVSCTTSSDCGCGLDLNSNACAIQNTQFLKAGRCTVPDFCTGISGKCGPSCVSGQCQLTCPPQNGKQTATTNESPSFTTKSLARVSTRRPYLGAISAMDKDRDAMKMTINGLPNGLRQGICTQGIYPVQPFGSTLTCAITGTTTSIGVFTVTATVKDARGSTTKSTFTLLSLPW